MINVLIGGDVCPINRNEEYFREGDVHRIWNDLLGEFQNSDLAIVNLECPLINESTPIEKEGPIHAVSSDCIDGIKRTNIGVVCLANNHILDHGATGLLNTLSACSEAGLTTVGAGENLEAASKLLVKEVKGIRVGILGVAEHEFSIATEVAPGANPLDIISYVRTIKRYNNAYDYLIVLVHAGAEGYPLPSPRLREICRFMAEMGADAVVCQHSHCPGCYENYEGSYLVYGQGNLVFDEDPNPDSPWNKGFLIKLTINGKGEHSMDIVPYVQSGAKPGVRKMSKNEEDTFMKEISDRSSLLDDLGSMHKSWINFCEEKKSTYFFQMLFGFLNNRLFRRIHSRVPFANYVYAKKHLMLLENMIRCESHREIIETILDENKKK